MLEHFLAGIQYAIGDLEGRRRSAEVGRAS